MKRTTIAALLGCLLLGTVGCCNSCCNGFGNKMGCGKLYVSDWYDGLGCDPCDKCGGNWTGQCGGCMKPWLQHWRFGCGGWYFPGLYGAAYGSRCQRCCGGSGPCCGNAGPHDDGYDHGDGVYDGAVSDQGVIYDGPAKDKPTVAPDSTNLIPPPSASTQRNQRQWRSVNTNR